MVKSPPTRSVLNQHGPALHCSPNPNQVLGRDLPQTHQATCTSCCATSTRMLTMMLRPAVNRYGLDRNGRKYPCESSWERGSLTDFHFESSSPFGPATLLIYELMNRIYKPSTIKARPTWLLGVSWVLPTLLSSWQETGSHWNCFDLLHYSGNPCSSTIGALPSLNIFEPIFQSKKSIDGPWWSKKIFFQCKSFL